MYKLCKKTAYREGFTLVELIVVIAILGILAGIAVPVYSGYIKKANEAADLQLLGAVNTAWAAACVENGVDPTKVTGTVTLSGEPGSMNVTGVSAQLYLAQNGAAALTAENTTSGAGAAELTAEKLASLNKSFMTYYGSNAAKPFKTYTSLGYDRANGVFVDGAKEYTFTTAYGTITVTAAQLSAYQASTFADIGTETLTDNIANLVNRVLKSDGFSKMIINDTSGTYSDFTDFLSDLGLTELTDTQKANALVLYTASLSNGLDIESIANAMATGGTISLSGSISDMATGTIAGSALVYAMMTSYANSGYAVPGVIPEQEKWVVNSVYNGSTYTNINEYADAKYGEGNYTITGRGTRRYINYNAPFDPKAYYETTSSTLTSTNNVMEMYNTFSQTDGFKNYMAEHGTADLNAYITAMNIINENVENLDSDALSTILSNGFTDASLNNMLISILGS